MDLISDQDAAEVRAALRDVTDTFHKETILYHLKNRGNDRFNEDNDTAETSDLELIGKVTWDKGPSEKIGRTGSVDLSKGKVNFDFQYLQEQNLIDAEGNPIMQAEEDFVTINGQLYDVTGVAPTGNFKGVYVLVTITIEKQGGYAGD